MRDVARAYASVLGARGCLVALTHTRDLSSDVVSGMVCGVIQAQCAG